MNQAAQASTQVRAALAPLAAAWRGLSQRDRNAATLAGIVVGLFLVWLLAVQPALRTLNTAPVELDALDAQLQAMQGLASEAAELRAAPPVTQQAATAVLQAATERLGEMGKLTLQGDRAVLTLKEVSTSALGEWLAEARTGARIRPLEATLTRGAQGYSGTLVVALGGGS